MKTSKGYALVESLLVMAVVGILSGLAVLTLSAQLPRHRLNGAAREVLSDLRLARELALAGGRPVSILFDFDSEVYRVQEDFPDGPVLETRDFKRAESGFKGVDLLDSSAGGRVTFFPKGTTNTFTTIRLRNSRGVVKKISVAVTGRATLQ